MATDLERMVISLEARTRAFENEMKRARNITDRQMRAIEKRTENMTKRVGKMMSSLGGGLSMARGGIGGVLAALGVRDLSRFADSFTKAQNALRVTGLEGERLETTFNEIAAIAQRTAAPLEAMSQLYGRLAASQKELHVTTPEMLRFTETVGEALKVQGTSAQEASGALLQLAQAMGGGIVRAEEFNSVNEGMRPLLQAAADGMEEAGGSVAKLRQFVVDGKVSSEAFFRAIQAGSANMAGKSRAAVETYGQAWQRVENAITLAVGKSNELANAQGAISRFADAVIEDISKIPGQFATTVREIEAVINLLNSLRGAAAAAVNRSRESSAQGLEQTRGEIDALRAKLDEHRATNNRALMGDIERRLKDAEARRDALAESVREANRAAGLGRGSDAPAVPRPTGPAPIDPDRMERPVRPIRAADYPGTGDGKKGKRERLNEYEREVAQIQERTRALEAERQTVGKSAGDVAKAEAAFRLLEAAKAANVAITPTLMQDIESIASKYGEMTTRLEEAEMAMESSRQAMQDFSDLAQDGLSTFIGDLRRGKSAAEALEGALERVVDRLIDMSLDSLINPNGAGLGRLFGSLFQPLGPALASGGYVRGPGTGRSDSIPARLSNGEYVVNAAATARHRHLLDAINSGRLQGFANGGFVFAPGGDHGSEGGFGKVLS